MSGETYAKRYAGGFVDAPSTASPIDSTFLNAVEVALVRLLGADPAVDTAPIWSAALGRFVFQKITNAQIAAAAAIDKTKLGALSIVDADVSGAAAIAQSKISFTAGGLAIASIADPTAGKVIGSSGSAAAAVFPPGYEYDYQQIVIQATSVATTEGTATALITSAALTFDGSTAIYVEAFSSLTTNTGSNQNTFVLYDSNGASSIGVWGFVGGSVALAGTPLSLRRKLTPSSGSHTYSLRLYVAAGTGAISASTGGFGQGVPAYIRITRA